MIHRDSSVAAYYDRISKKIHCRLCISKNIPIVHRAFRDVCYEMICCSYGRRSLIRYFNFNNTKHDIVISETKCKMCSYRQGNCLVEKGHECPFKIPEYTRDFSNQIDKVARKM